MRPSSGRTLILLKSQTLLTFVSLVVKFIILLPVSYTHLEINTNKTIQKWGISCVGNADVPHYVVNAHAKEKTSKKIEKTVDFSA